MAKSNDPSYASLKHRRPDGVAALDGLRVVSEKIPSGYERSLRTARERNRKRLPRPASPEALARQRMEQGFTLYFQGANQGRRAEARCAPKTAGPLDQEPHSGNATFRLKTAPDEASGRRKWERPSNFRLCGLDRTDAGDAGYSEDFDDSGSEWESSGLSAEEMEEEEEEGNFETVMLSLDDVKSLRRSLNLFGQMKSTLRDSVAEMCDIAEEIADEVAHETRLGSENEKAAVVVLELQRPQKTQNLAGPPRKQDPLATSVDSIANAMAQENAAVERLQALIQRAMQLTDTQQDQLVSALGNIERIGETEAKIPSNPVPPNTFSPTVELELLSNWGHPSKIGLTEVEFFDQRRQPIEVTRVDLLTLDGVTHSDRQEPDLANLTNGRRKTTKERHMWAIEHRPTAVAEQPLRLVFFLRAAVSDLAKIVVWNYNNTLRNLDVGVRECRIYYGGDLVFDGDIEKGCGNQVFDYGTAVQLGKPEPASQGPTEAQPTESSEPELNEDENLCSAAAMHRSREDQLRSPIPRLEEPARTEKKLATPRADKTSVPKSETPRSEKLATPRADKGSVPKSETPKSEKLATPRTDKGSVPKSETPRSEKLATPRTDKTSAPKSESSTPRPEKSAGLPRPEKVPLKHSKEDQLDATPRKPAVSCSTDDDDCLLHQLQEYKRSRGVKESPAWLRQSNGEAPPFKKGSLGMTGWPGVGGRRHLQTELDAAEESEKEARFGRRSRSGHDSGRAGDSESDSEDETDTPMQRLLSSRSDRRRVLQDKASALQPSLEASWSSLNFFDKFHAGRISTDLQGDALDECLQRRRLREPESGPPEEAVSPVPEDDESFWSDEEFCIPELPIGRDLLLNIRTTWGDRHYVGLTGIEAFGADGEPCEVASITAEPSDINILPDYGSDPRVVTNLIDGVNRTRDDTHMWLAPFTPGRPHLVRLIFSRPYRLALLRIWNYNKSRIHSSRGACDVEIQLDSKFIFKGEVARASGNTANETGETILFTMDESILELVAVNDEAFPEDESDSENEAMLQTTRPSTSDKGRSPPEDAPKTARPFTCAARKKKKSHGLETGSKLKFDFTATWGDRHYLGLTGLEVVGAEGEALNVTAEQLRACPRDMRVLQGCEQDSRTLDKLVNGITLTAEDVNMWMVPYTEGESHTLEIALPKPTAIAGFRVWNYNKSIEDSYRGARCVHLCLDGRRLSPPEGYMLRRAPGYCAFDFAQEILFVDNGRHTEQHEGFPCGFIYRLDLLSTWGDPYYAGLTGLELLDPCGRPIPLSTNNVAALPPDVNVLPNVQGDVRTPDKLVDGVIEGTCDGQHSWLAPILPEIVNRIFIIFDFPVSVGVVHLWNYAKTPQRGVKDFSLLVDDLLVFSGTLPSVATSARGILPTVQASIPRWSVLMAENAELARSEPPGAVLNGQASAMEQDVMLTNDRQVVSRYAKPPERVPDPQLRPKTSVTKPKTGYKRH